MGMGRYDKAKNILDIGLREFPKSYSLWTDMGILYDELGDYPHALKYFEVALKITRGENPGCLYNKAVILIKLHEYGNAMSIIDYLIERYPEEPKYLAQGGCCLREMGYPQEAIKYLQKAMGLFKKSPTVDVGVTIFSGLCSAYLDLGLKKESMEIALEGLTKFPDSDPVLYHNLATCFYELGWTAESRRLLEIGVEKFPNDLELKQFLNDVEQELDDPDGDVKPFLGLLMFVALFHKRLRDAGGESGRRR
jgi:tetratricopeptide (TPR) repeat protein